MIIETYRLIEGAKRADGLAVIIDVFRAFSMECYLYAMGAREIRPVGGVEALFAWREKDGGCVLVGERHGKKLEGCDLGNSPSSIQPGTILGKRIVHSTSAGTQGIVNAARADEIITGSFVNAKAIAEYIRRKAPDKVSLVCMGKEGVAPAEEDDLCAAYLESLLKGRDMPDIDVKLKGLRNEGGRHFFDPENQEVFPESDFWMCIDRDQFDFVLRIERDDDGFVSKMIRL
ncbi:MAG: 2-phosphosulfolactate phosphatase [Clostridia bacterium]|nr:2-phosphosulfolactate phosphatase [Clostridia bacterium]